MVTARFKAPGLLEDLPGFLVPWLGLNTRNSWLQGGSGFFALGFTIGVVSTVIVGFELLAVALNTLVSSGNFFASFVAWIGGLLFLFVAFSTIFFAWEVFAFVFGYLLGWKSGVIFALVTAVLTLLALSFCTPFSLAEGLRAIVQTWPPGQAMLEFLERQGSRERGSSLAMMSFVLLPTMVKGCMLSTLRIPAPQLGVLCIPSTIFHAVCLPFFGAKAYEVATEVADRGGFHALSKVLGWWELAYGTVFSFVLGLILYKAHQEYGHWAYLFGGCEDMEAPLSVQYAVPDSSPLGLSAGLSTPSTGPTGQLLEMNLLCNDPSQCNDNQSQSLDGASAKGQQLEEVEKSDPCRAG